MIYKDTWNWPEIPVECADREDIETIYSFGHYDGPKTGLVSWKSKFYYVDRFGGDNSDNNYWLIELSDLEAEYCKLYGSEWARLFGSQMSWNPDGESGPFISGIHTITQTSYIGYDQAKYNEFRTTHPVPKPSENAKVAAYFIGWRS